MWLTLSYEDEVSLKGRSRVLAMSKKQTQHGGDGSGKWKAVRAVAVAKPAEVAAPVETTEPAEVVDVIPALTTEEIGAFKPEVFDEAKADDAPGDYVEVKIAKKAMNYRFVIGTKGEVVRVQDSARVKVGMLLLAKKNARGQFDTKEVVR